ncbi:MAG: sulfotransferase [Methylococcales bacterium]
MNKVITQSNIPVISGSGRSGTTWVLDVLAQANQMRTAFEPLHPIAVSEMKQYANLPINRTDVHLELLAFLTNIFSGNFKSLWIDYRVRPDRLIPSLRHLSSFTKLHEYLARWRKLYRQSSCYKKYMGRPVITKFIRANLMYNWLLENFNLKIVHVTRHPCAVIESKLRLGGDDWDVEKELHAYLDKDYISEWVALYIQTAQIEGLSEAGRYALIWCIENILPFSEDNHALEKQVLKVHFESLASHDAEVWMSVCSHLTLKNVPGKALLIKPSQQARPENKAVNYDKKMTNGWRQRLTIETMTEIELILKYFKVTEYSIDSLDPIITG